jgi:hypothetical protein
VDVFEGLRPVDGGLPRPEELQIRPGKDQNSCLPPLLQASSAISFGAAVLIR